MPDSEILNNKFLYAIFIPFVSTLNAEELEALAEELKGIENIEDIPDFGARQVLSSRADHYQHNPRRRNDAHLVTDLDAVYADKFDENAPNFNGRAVLNNACDTRLFQIQADGSLKLTVRGLGKFFSIEAQLTREDLPEDKRLSPGIINKNPALGKLMPKPQM